MVRAAGTVVVAVVHALGGLSLERPPQVAFERRVQKFVHAGAHRAQYGFRFGGLMQRHQHDVGRHVADVADDCFQRFAKPGDFDQKNVRPHSLDAVPKSGEVRYILLFDQNAHRKVLYTGLHRFPEFFRFDGQTNC